MQRYYFTAYIDPDVKDELELYCYLKSKNRMRLINDALREYLKNHLTEELKSNGIIK